MPMGWKHFLLKLVSPLEDIRWRVSGLTGLVTGPSRRNRARRTQHNRTVLLKFGYGYNARGVPGWVDGMRAIWFGCRPACEAAS